MDVDGEFSIRKSSSVCAYGRGEVKRFKSHFIIYMFVCGQRRRRIISFRSGQTEEVSLNRNLIFIAFQSIYHVGVQSIGGPTQSPVQFPFSAFSIYLASISGFVYLPWPARQSVKTSYRFTWHGMFESRKERSNCFMSRLSSLSFTTRNWSLWRMPPPMFVLRMNDDQERMQYHK